MKTTCSTIGSTPYDQAQMFYLWMGIASIRPGEPRDVWDVFNSLEEALTFIKKYRFIVADEYRTQGLLLQVSGSTKKILIDTMFTYHNNNGYAGMSFIEYFDALNLIHHADI